MWRVMSVNRDANNVEFISSMEHQNYPFYGVQFHPEKNLYEWASNKDIPHTLDAIEASQYFAQFFVNEARKSANSFEDANKYLIYNFDVTYTGVKYSSFQQCYLFPKNVEYKNLK